MQNEIVMYNCIYWPIKDLNGTVTKDSAPIGSTCHTLMTHFLDVPKKISNFVKNKNVVIQAGGNAGYYPKLYSEIFNEVYTFEPEPLLFFCLNLNTPTPNVHKFQACLGDKHKMVSLNNTCDTYGHGGTHVAEFDGGNIPTLMIDNLNLQVCDLIHLDIEGYEKKAILGGVETIKRCKPVIVIEYYSFWLERYGTNLEEIESILTSLEYKYIAEVQGDRVYVPNNYN